MLVFPVVKLLDFKTRTVELEASANPFALVVLAQLAATATKRDPAARLDRKIGLTRRLVPFRPEPRRGVESVCLHRLGDDVARAVGGRLPSGHSSPRRGGADAIRHHGRANRHAQGIERGLESERALLQRLARRRFGDAVAEPAAVLLALIRAPETLEQLGEGLLDDADGEVWLTAVQAQVEHSDEHSDG